jgi:hypothetical protein
MSASSQINETRFGLLAGTLQQALKIGLVDVLIEIRITRQLDQKETTPNNTDRTTGGLFKNINNKK